MVNNNVNSDKCVPKSSVKVVPTTDTSSDTQKSKNKDNMPKIDISHEVCGIANCMSCAFNVMYVYFNSKHASSDKTAPRRHMNSKKNVKSKSVPSELLNNVKHVKTETTSPQHLNNAKKI